MMMQRSEMMLKRILSTGIALVMMAVMAVGQARETIEDAIGGQLDAFNARDVSEAFSYASPMIRDIFGDADSFGDMVENGFPMVWDNTDVRYLAMQELDGVTVQRVMVTGANGTLHTLEYMMIDSPDGWLINGVQLVEPDLAA